MTDSMALFVLKEIYMDFVTNELPFKQDDRVTPMSQYLTSLDFFIYMT